jgi:hypothetical protein
VIIVEPEEVPVQDPQPVTEPAVVGQWPLPIEAPPEPTLEPAGR